MKRRRSLDARREIRPRTAMHQGTASAWPWEGRAQSPSAGWRWTVFRRNHPRRSGHLPSVKISRLMMAFPSGGEDGYVGLTEQVLSHACAKDWAGREEPWRERCPAGDRSRVARACRIDPVPPCLTPTGPVRAGPGPGAGHSPADPGSGAARPCRGGLVAGGVRSPARWPAVGGDRGAAARRCCAGVGE